MSTILQADLSTLMVGYFQGEYWLPMGGGVQKMSCCEKFFRNFFSRFLRVQSVYDRCLRISNNSLATTITNTSWKDLKDTRMWQDITYWKNDKRPSWVTFPLRQIAPTFFAMGEQIEKKYKDNEKTALLQLADEFEKALNSKSTDKIKELMAKNPGKQNELLCLLAEKNNFEAVEILFKSYKADPNFYDSSNQLAMLQTSAFSQAIYHANEKMVDLLLPRVNPALENCKGQNGYLPPVTYFAELSKKGQRKNPKNIHGMFSKAFSHQYCTDMLLHNHPLFFEEEPEIIKAIIDYRNQKDIKNFPVDAKGRNPIHLAAQTGNLPKLKYFRKEFDGDEMDGFLNYIDLRDLEGCTPFFLAAQANQVECVKELLASENVAYKQANSKGQLPIDATTSKEIKDLIKAKELASIPL